MGIYFGHGPLVHDDGCFQRSCRGTAPRDPRHADRRREGGRSDRGRPLDVPASGLETPTRAQRGRARQLPGAGAPSPVPPGARAPSAAARLDGQVRAGLERPTRSDGGLPQGATTRRRAAVTPNRHGSAVVEFPSELEIVTTREFDAPLELVFDVFTKPEHVRNWFAPFSCVVTECSIDLRVGGSYHVVFVTEDGTECSFRGTYLEVEPPTRTVATWLLEGWPDADAVESVDLHETDGVTTLTMTMVFRDRAGRAHMGKSDGQQSSFDHMEDYLRTLLEQKTMEEVHG